MHDRYSLTDFEMENRGAIALGLTTVGGLASVLGFAVVAHADGAPCALRALFGLGFFTTGFGFFTVGWIGIPAYEVWRLYFKK